jgi:hypothetical protein
MIECPARNRGVRQMAAFLDGHSDFEPLSLRATILLEEIAARLPALTAVLEELALHCATLDHELAAVDLNHLAVDIAGVI